jgi:hypothetical protein
MAAPSATPSLRLSDDALTEYRPVKAEAAKPSPDGKCLHCGTRLKGGRNDKVCCTPAHRVAFNREKLREAVISRQEGVCALQGLGSDDNAGENLENLDEPFDAGPCGLGDLVLVKHCQDEPKNEHNCFAVCRRHKARLGEQKYRLRLGDELYRMARRQQGVEKFANRAFRLKVKGFNQGFVDPSRLGPESSWRKERTQGWRGKFDGDGLRTNARAQYYDD